MKKKFLVFIVAILMSVSFGTTAFSAEPEKEVKASVAVNALVPTTVCAQYSSVTTNVSQILADSSQKVTITVRLRDCSQVAVADAYVFITSNRGAIDKIKNVDEDGEEIKSGDGLGVLAQTDANGFTFFQVYSGVPGEAIFSTKIDQQLNLDQVRVTFLPLPFPKNIVVSVEVPKFIAPSGQITIFQPKNLDYDKDKLVNLTMELRIPIWVFYLVIGIIIIDFLMFLTILILIFRIKRMQKKEVCAIEETQELVKEEKAEIDDLEKKNGNTPPPSPPTV